MTLLTTMTDKFFNNSCIRNDRWHVVIWRCSPLSISLTISKSFWAFLMCHQHKCVRLTFRVEVCSCRGSGRPEESCCARLGTKESNSPRRGSYHNIYNINSSFIGRLKIIYRSNTIYIRHTVLEFPFVRLFGAPCLCLLAWGTCPEASM